MSDGGRLSAITDEQYTYPIRQFERVGIELEYMIVDRKTLNVNPICDEALRAVSGSYESDAEPDGPDGIVGWSNELALHVIELKTVRPVGDLHAVLPIFQDHVQRINTILEPMRSRLMPTAMHPWMLPDRDLKLWPHEYNAVYEAFNRIFGCTGHGWANLQSTHINLPFGNDEEFGRLHAAIRAVLPLIPAVAASSPACEGRVSQFADTRIETYRGNSKRIPSIAGMVIPEPVFTRRDYEEKLLGRIYADLKPHDPDGILQFEWANARGCIARFDRGAIEIRLVDIQECPLADLAIAFLLVELTRALTEERWCPIEVLQGARVETLHSILLAAAKAGEDAPIEDAEFLGLFGQKRASLRARELLAELIDELVPQELIWREPLDLIVRQGTLSTRIRRALGEGPDSNDFHRVYRGLCDCLQEGRQFDDRT